MAEAVPEEEQWLAAHPVVVVGTWPTIRVEDLQMPHAQWHLPTRTSQTMPVPLDHLAQLPVAGTPTTTAINRIPPHALASAVKMPYPLATARTASRMPQPATQIHQGHHSPLHPLPYLQRSPPPAITPHHPHLYRPSPLPLRACLPRLPMQCS